MNAKGLRLDCFFDAVTVEWVASRRIEVVVVSGVVQKMRRGGLVVDKGDRR